MLKQENSSEKDLGGHIYKLTITGFDSGLNELLNGVHYDYRIKKLVNPVKKKNDDLMIKQLRFSPIRNIKLKTPIEIHYDIYAKDKRRDRMNIGSCFDKCFCDSLQKAGILSNDGWNEIVNVSFDYFIDKMNPRVEVTIEEVDSK